jgi:hypothetical protein
MEAPSYEDIRPPAASVSATRERSSQGGKIGRDHSHVLGELRRISIIVAIIVAGLVITAILR